MDTSSTFLNAIKQLLCEWPALKLAIDNGMGGSEGEEKRDWMGPVIQQHFVEFPDLLPDEVSEYIAVILNQEFDTVVEDGSLELLSSLLCKFYTLCQKGDLDKVNQMLEERRKNTAAKQELSSSQAPVSQMNTLSIEEPIDSVDTVEETNASSDDGWTVVQRKKR